MTATHTRMKFRILSPFVLFIAVLPVLIAVAASAQQAGQPSAGSSASFVPADQGRILDLYGKLPLSFEANQGQADAQVKFLSRTRGYSLYLTADEAILALSGNKTNTDKTKATGHRSQPGAAVPKAGGVLRMKLRNANPAVKVSGVDALAGTNNYFIGNDPAKWRTNVPTYAKVKYERIYSGIDLVYYGNEQQLEFDFIVAPGADPGRIAFDVSGAKGVRRDALGDLVLKMSEGEVRWHKPVAYQEKNGARREITARYAITATNRVAIELANYDSSIKLYIDPLIYSTYLGGSGDDFGTRIAVDSSGNAYVAGQTSSADFPTMNPLQAPPVSGDIDAFVAKISPDGSSLIYSTYLGGSNQDWANSIAVDSAGNAYVTGATSSTDFPTEKPLQPANGGGSDAFVAKINPTGSALVFSTYLGGSGQDIASGIAVDSSGNAYVTGQTLSADFPTTTGAFQTVCGGGGCWDAFVAKINPTGSAWVYSTYLGGTGIDDGQSGAIAADDTGNAYVTGDTSSTDFPMMHPLQSAKAGAVNAYVTKINPTGSALVYSTYLGGSRTDFCNGIAVDGARNVYVTGQALSADFPTTPGAFQTVNGGGYDAFVTKINSSGSALVYSTYLGGLDRDQGNSIAVDSTGSAYITGETLSGNFPTVTPFQYHRQGPPDAFVSKINPTGAILAYSSYLGGRGNDSGTGIALDSTRNAYVTGSTSSANFPTKNALQPTYGGGTSDAFVTKVDMRAVPTLTLASSLNPSIYGQSVTLTAVATSAIGTPPNGETVTFKKYTLVLGVSALSGGSASFATSTLPVATNPITAVYSGDSTFGGSKSKVLSQVVEKATTTTTLTSSQNPSNPGQFVTFTATVTPQFGGKVNGTVSFYDGATLLKTVYLSGGAAKYSTSTLTSGKHTITATYNGSTDFTGSSASLTQTVQP